MKDKRYTLDVHDIVADYQLFKAISLSTKIEQVKQLIMEAGGEKGLIRDSKNRPIPAENVARIAGRVFEGSMDPNMLTRSYGIRAHVLYLLSLKLNKQNWRP